jgi:CRP/FNR family transcriptional regulator, cyclic AMP receptor protein
MLRGMASRDSYLDQLRSVPMMSAFSKKELTKVARATDEVHVKAGREIVHEGKAGHECYVVLKGKADVVLKGKAIATFGPGDHFGELALLDGGPRTASVVAKTDMDLLVLGQREFLALLEEIPGLSRKIMGNLASQIRRLDDTLYD